MNQRFCSGIVHVIKPGDTLYRISRTYKVPLPLIFRANPYVDVYNLQPGQEICVPMKKIFPGACCPVRPQPREDVPDEPGSSGTGESGSSKEGLTKDS